MQFDDVHHLCISGSESNFIYLLIYSRDVSYSFENSFVNCEVRLIEVSAFSAIYNKQIAWCSQSDGEASVRICFVGIFFFWCDRKSHHRTTLIVIIELKFVFPIVLYDFCSFCLFFLLFSFTFVWNQSTVCLQAAKAIMFFFGLPKAFCAKWLLSSQTHTHTNIHMHEIEMEKEEKKRKRYASNGSSIGRQQRWFRHESGMTWMKSSHIYTHTSYTSHHIT